MASSLIIELESGTILGPVHPHNGYFSGFFSGRPLEDDETPARGHGANAASV